MMRAKLLEGFVFAGPEDEANALALVEALWASVNEVDAEKREPAFLLCGAPRSGKTTMLWRFMASLQARLEEIPVAAELDRRVFDFVMKRGQRVMVISLLGNRELARAALTGAVLKEWLAAETWKGGKQGLFKRVERGQARYEPVDVLEKIKGVTVVQTFWTDLAAEAPEGMKVIRLLERVEAKPEVRAAA